ncbi:alpha/beta hydrolase family protein [Cronobacter dublinensis]|uniref:alpha/beta hydrolase family protein n=1 Tax=Cronobacter dublinensis TaxID=413497 RepID=UPI000CFBF69F|nr:alpha/beta hydrolase [Cronobacter dublinensis]
MTKKVLDFTGVLLISMALFLAGCTGKNFREYADAQATKRDLIGKNFSARGLPLRTWQRITPPVTRLRVYIEGDGFAWVSRSRPSDDPTPHNPTGLKLAAADPSANVLYMARPCQFIGPPLPPTCNVHLWTDQRFSPQIVQAMDEALSQIVQPYPQARIELVGYSGGGNIAALLAARRTDVVSLRTVAGNLDVAYVNALHRVSAMPDARSAADVALMLANLPQRHFSGADDDTVPPAVATRFQQATGERCAQVEVVPGMNHGSDWAALWPGLLAKTPVCR